jgi:hypothetical protein
MEGSDKALAAMFAALMIVELWNSKGKRSKQFQLR